MHICEICKKKPATIHLTDIHNNEKKELHICQECAEAKGVALQQNSISLPDLLSGLSKNVSRKATKDPVCENCGLKFSEFQQRGRLGCSNDYRAFREELVPMLERIHGKAQHVGKRPDRDSDSPQQKKLADLQRRMRDAVEREAYEDAASLRDEIRQLKEENDSGE